MKVTTKTEKTFFQYEHEKVRDQGWKVVFYYDPNKTTNGAYKTEMTYPKDFEFEKFKADKGKAYNKQPVVMAFKTSNRSNAQTKIKVWNNENIDYILKAKTLPGVPDTAVILEVGVGESFIEYFENKYK